MQLFQTDDALIQSKTSEGNVAIQKIGNIWSSNTSPNAAHCQHSNSARGNVVAVVRHSRRRICGGGLLILLMLSGIGQVTGLTYKIVEPVKAWVIHKALALALCGAIVVHVVSCSSTIICRSRSRRHSFHSCRVTATTRRCLHWAQRHRRGARDFGSVLRRYYCG